MRSSTQKSGAKEKLSSLPLEIEIPSSNRYSQNLITEAGGRRSEMFGAGFPISFSPMQYTTEDAKTRQRDRGRKPLVQKTGIFQCARKSVCSVRAE